MLTITSYSLAQQASAVLTVDDAVRIATGENKQIKISGLDVVKARESLAETRAGMFPQLHTYVLAGYELDRVTFTIPAGSFGVYPATGPIPATNEVSTPARFGAYIYGYFGQPVTQLYKTNLAVHEARLGVDLAKENLRSRRQETIGKVKEAYHQLAQMQSEITSADAAVKYMAELAALTDRNLKQQAVLLSDSLAVSAKLKQQRYQLQTLQGAFDLQKEAFNRLLGRDVRTHFSIEPQPPPEFLEWDLEASRKQALERRPEIREARLQREMAGLDVRREKAEYIPDFSLQLSYQSFQNMDFLPQNVASAGFAFDWQPLDWGAKKHRTAELRAIAEQKELVEEDAEQGVILDVDQKYQKLNQARMLLDADAEVQKAEQQKLIEMTRLYEQQTILLADLLQQQAAVSQADAQYQQALATFWTARAEFEQAVGED